MTYFIKRGKLLPDKRYIGTVAEAAKLMHIQEVSALQEMKATAIENNPYIDELFAFNPRHYPYYGILK